MKYYIASLKHTDSHCEHITFWGRNHCGYTPVVGAYIGEYDDTEAGKLNDGYDFIAVPVEVVETLLSPEPYYKPGARFYDQRGPVVDNTRKNWKVMIEASGVKAKPEVFKGQRRSYSE